MKSRIFAGFLVLMGYDAEAKVYTYDAFNNLGEADHSRAQWKETRGLGPPKE
jgi:hypothetical protein